MKDHIRYGNSIISYTITKSKRRKTSQIIVDEKGIEVKTPITKKESEIKQMVSDKKEWIFKKQLEFSDRKKQKKTKTKTLQYMERRVWRLASKIGTNPSKVIIKKMNSRWGSANKNNVICLNEALTKTPSRIIDYIIIHELAHLKIRDHSYKFWSLVQKYCSDYNQRQRWLEDNFRLVKDTRH